MCVETIRGFGALQRATVEGSLIELEPGAQKYMELTIRFC